MAATEATEAPVYSRAPVFAPGGTIMPQTGWFRYKKEPDSAVVLCIRNPEKKSMSCLVYIVDMDKQEAALVMVDGIAPTEEKT
jgi:hypothetical protein